MLDTHSMKGHMKNHSTLIETGEFIIKRLNMKVMKVLLKGNYLRCMSYAIAAGAFQPCWWCYSEHFQNDSKHNLIFKIGIIHFVCQCLLLMFQYKMFNVN